MAGESFQNEIPPSRVNIKYVKATDGASEEIELPLKLLVVGDFTMQNDETPLEDRSRVGVDQNNFKDVMHEQKLGLDLVVPDKLSGADGEEMAVKLNFEELSDFSPTGIAEQVPELNKILTVRNLLKDLKARVISNRDFRKELEKIVKNQEQLDQLLGELKAVAPEGDAGEGGDNG